MISSFRSRSKDRNLINIISSDMKKSNVVVRSNCHKRKWARFSAKVKLAQYENYKLKNRNID